MARFFNKNELIILVLVILLFDLNSFCESCLPQIINRESINIVFYGLILTFLALDVYVFYTQVESIPTFSTYYAVEPIPLNGNYCQTTVAKEITVHENEIKQLKNLDCATFKVDDQYIHIKQAVLTFTSVILIGLIVLGLILEGSNPMWIRCCMVGPILLVAIGMLYLAYKPVNQ